LKQGINVSDDLCLLQACMSFLALGLETVFPQWKEQATGPGDDIALVLYLGLGRDSQSPCSLTQSRAGLSHTVSPGLSA